MNSQNDHDTSPSPSSRMPEHCVQEAFAIARGLEKLHVRFEKLLERTPDGYEDRVLDEPDGDPRVGHDFISIKDRLWAVARNYAVAADCECPLACPADKGVRS